MDVSTRFDDMLQAALHRVDCMPCASVRAMQSAERKARRLFLREQKRTIEVALLTEMDEFVAARKALKLTQTDIGRIADVHQVCISMVENGRTEGITTEKLAALHELYTKVLEKWNDRVAGRSA